MKVGRVPKVEALEKRFLALPPIGTENFCQHIRLAPKKELPPEVLARAYRSVRPKSRPAKIILERLFGRSRGRWE